MNIILNRIKKEFSKNPDLIIKELNFSLFKQIYIVYLETVTGSDKVNNYILKVLINSENNKINKKTLNNFLAGPNTKKVDNRDKIEFYLTNGFTIILLDNYIYAVETKADLTRSITSNEKELSINGPKDSFTENIQTNIGLVKRRIKTSTLKFDNRFVGRITNTLVSVAYFEDIADPSLVNNILKKLDLIDIDIIVDSSSLAYLLDGENKTVFPTTQYSERPDDVVISLSRGKIAIFVDTSPFVLIIPAFFIDFINPKSDNYSKSININLLKVLRLLAFFVAVMTPAIYNALMSYNPESIPTNLLINFAVQRQGVPFPIIVETVIMLLICDVLRESNLRIPSGFGSTVSILGAIIIGEAAVRAGIVSPIMIIIIALTFIFGLVFNDIEINYAIKHFSLVFLFFSSILGLYGIILAFIYFLIIVCSTNSYGLPYSFPFAPFDKTYFYNTVLKKELKKDTKRSTMLTKKNITKQGEN
ncbi:MAG: spore germination protein [Bacilli bacterium]